MHQRFLELLCCPECRGNDLKVEPLRQDAAGTVEGRLICSTCARWFRIENGIPDLLPRDLRDEQRYVDFANRFGLQYNAEKRGTPDLAKVQQIDFFRKDVERYEVEVANSSFYRALDEVNFSRWRAERLRKGMRVLELGCGTGRQTRELGEAGMQVVGVDISEEMLTLARQKVVASGLTSEVLVLMGDAENPPVRPASFNGCLIYGTLHHLPNPAMAIASGARSLVPGGVLYTLDPHRSPLRWLFDLMMRIKKLYDEEAREDPLLEESQLLGWLEQAGLEGHTELSTYLPPHLLYPCSVGFNRLALRISDRLFRRVPGIRKIAGIITAEGVKPAVP